MYDPTRFDVRITREQRGALLWLIDHGGTGVFNKYGVLLAGGEYSNRMRSTWNFLRDFGYITIDQRRVTVNEE